MKMYISLTLGKSLLLNLKENNIVLLTFSLYLLISWNAWNRSFFQIIHDGNLNCLTSYFTRVGFNEFNLFSNLIHPLHQTPFGGGRSLKTSIIKQFVGQISQGKGRFRKKKVFKNIVKKNWCRCESCYGCGSVGRLKNEKKKRMVRVIFSDIHDT